MNRNYFPSLFVTTCVFSIALYASDKAEVEKHYEAYKLSGKAVVDMVIAKKVDSAQAEKKLRDCIEEAKWFCVEYAKAFPKGEKLLKTVLDNTAAMEKLSFEEIEKEWHDLGFFAKPGNNPGIDLKEEDNEHFTDPIHTLVHPLMVLKAAQSYASSKADKDLQAMKEEMEEGLEQAAKQKDALLKK